MARGIRTLRSMYPSQSAGSGFWLDELLQLRTEYSSRAARLTEIERELGEIEAEYDKDHELLQMQLRGRRKDTRLLTDPIEAEITRLTREEDAGGRDPARAEYYRDRRSALQNEIGRIRRERSGDLIAQMHSLTEGRDEAVAPLRAERTALRQDPEQMLADLERAGTLLWDGLVQMGITEDAAYARERAALAVEFDEASRALQTKEADYYAERQSLEDDERRAMWGEVVGLRHRLMDIGTREREVERAMRATRREMVINALSSVREVGYTDEQRDAISFAPRSVKKYAEHVREVTAIFPREWLDAALADSAEIRVAKVNRGHYSYGGDISVLGVSHGDDDHSRETAAHELTHRIERTYPAVLQAEAALYERRTRAEDGMAQDEIRLGGGYRKDEVYRPGDPPFAKKYQGKWYGGRSYELMSMGIEDLWAGNVREESLADEEVRTFVLGTLALV